MFGGAAVPFAEVGVVDPTPLVSATPEVPPVPADPLPPARTTTGAQDIVESAVTVDTALPEPGSLALCLAGLAAWRWRGLAR